MWKTGHVCVFNYSVCMNGPGQPLGEGFIAVVLMKLDDAANICSVLLTEEAYNVQQKLTAPSQNGTLHC